MPQTVLSLTLELHPASVGRVRDLLDAWRTGEEQGREMYADLRMQVPGLHFMSITVFSDIHYDPLLVIESSIDSRPELFWQQLAAGYGDVLQSLIRCCKRPAGRTGALFDAAIAPGASAAIPGFLHRAAARPIVAHQGHRGLDRSRIEQQATLFDDTQLLLACRAPKEIATPAGLHAELRAALLPGHPWLSQPAPARISFRESLSDRLSLALAFVLLLFGLSLPGLLLTALNTVVALTVIACVGLGAALTLRHGAGEAPAKGTADDAKHASAEFALMLKHAAPWLATTGHLVAASALFVAAYAAAGSAIVALVHMGFGGELFRAACIDGIRAMMLALASLGATVPLLLLWLRHVERDPAQDEPLISSEGLASMERAEDQIAQNHMASLVLIKPGVLRAVLLRAGLRGLGLLLRVLATDGYLGSMRTIHFAQWSIVGNGSRLLFFSNFDGSWESYLDDFIEKAHGGLSLAWGSCVGFPPCRFLVLGGASHGRQFKAWARRSMAPASFWFSAYPADTVNQVERRTACANGLRQTTLTEQEAAAWIRTL